MTPGIVIEWAFATAIWVAVIFGVVVAIFFLKEDFRIK